MPSMAKRTSADKMECLLEKNMAASQAMAMRKSRRLLYLPMSHGAPRESARAWRWRRCCIGDSEHMKHPKELQKAHALSVPP